MTTAETPDKTSTRHHRVDARFAALLAEDFGIPSAIILDALEGEPQKTAIALCEWAFEKTDDPARALVAWASKHGKGRCRRAARPATERPARRHAGRTERPREQQDERRRGTAPARRRGVSGALDPARVRANVQRMAD